MQFDLTDLRLFVRAAEVGSLTRAAAASHLSLPAASARVRALETQAGMNLFLREARGVRLTPAGDAFLHHARAVLRQAAQLRADLDEHGGDLRGHLRIHANTTAVTEFLPEVLPSFLKSHPRVNVELQEHPNALIAHHVLDGRADLGITAGPVDRASPVETPGLRSVHFSTDRLVLAVPADHALADRRRIDFASTLDEPQVGMHAGSTLQTFLTQVADRLGRTQKLRVQLSSFEAMCRLIGAGVGIGVLPESVARRHAAALGLALLELNDDWSVRERLALVRERDRLPPYSEDLIARLIAHHSAGGVSLNTPPAASA
mgnify:CR=1 FL=1